MEWAEELSREKQALDGLPAEVGDVHEEEGRLGTLTPDGFVNGLSKTDFETIVRHLMSLYRADGTGRIRRIEEHQIEDVAQSSDIRVRTSRRVSSLPSPLDAKAPASSTETVQKTRLGWIDCRMLQCKYDVRLSLKRERPKATAAGAGGGVGSRRGQTRRTFWTADRCRVDASIVTFAGGATATYELEVEDVGAERPHVPIVEWLTELNALCTHSANKSLLFVRLTDSASPQAPAPAPAAVGKRVGKASDTLLVETTRGICRPRDS